MDPIQLINALQRRVQVLEDSNAARSRQQLFAPMDDVSKAVLGALTSNGAGSKALTQTVSVAATPTTIHVPSAYSGTFIVVDQGVQREVPFL